MRSQVNYYADGLVIDRGRDATAETGMGVLLNPNRGGLKVMLSVFYITMANEDATALRSNRKELFSSANGRSGREEQAFGGQV